MLFKIKVIKDFQIKLLSMISEKRFFNSALVGKTVLMKNKKKLSTVLLRNVRL